MDRMNAEETLFLFLFVCCKIVIEVQNIFLYYLLYIFHLVWAPSPIKQNFVSKLNRLLWLFV